MVDSVDPGRAPIKPRVIGRYALFGEIAAGGMATVHFGRLLGPVGFSRTVAIKRLHPQYAKDPEFVAMFLDEARLASRVQHPNVVTTLDVVAMPDEVFLVMEYVQGESLSRIAKNARKEGSRMPFGHVVAVMSGVLHGLHAAHEAKSERREPLNIVHRDVSPQNVLVGTDGVSRVLDFGVAKAAMRAGTTRDKQMKGKLSYMSPEQLNAKPVDRRTDLFAAGVVLWEVLCGQRLFDGADAGEIFAKVLAGHIEAPKDIEKDVPDVLNSVVMRALDRNVDKRYQTAREFAIDLESSVPLSTARAVGEWVEIHAAKELARRAEALAEIEAVAATAADFEGLDEPPTEDRTSRPSISQVQSKAGSGARISRAPSEPPGGEDTRSETMPEASTLAVSSVAVSGLTPRPPVKSMSRGLWIGAVAACVSGGALAFLMFARSDRGGAARSLPNSASPSVSGAALPRSSPPTETVRVEDLPPAPADADTDFSEAPLSQGAPRLPGFAGPRRAPVKSAPKGAPSAAPVPASTCSPPYTIDENGIRRLKAGCF